LCFLAFYYEGNVELSEEHTEYKWFTSDEIEKNEEIKPWLKEFVISALERLKEREYLNDAKRIYADFENYRRRQEERMKELSTVCAEGFALDMIPVIDNFRAAALHVPEGEKTGAWMTGITYIGKQLEEVLATRGLVAYEAKEGEMFDPYLHEAVSHEKGKEGEEGKIVKSLQPGYKMGTRVIRPAKVIVG
jgi:molecular chaperone GrpE